MFTSSLHEVRCLSGADWSHNSLAVHADHRQMMHNENSQLRSALQTLQLRFTLDKCIHFVMVSFGHTDNF